MSFTFSVVFFPIKPSREILVLILLCHNACTVLLSGLNWKKKKRIRENAMCVKLNLYFFYKNIVYKYLFACIDIAKAYTWLVN